MQDEACYEKKCFWAGNPDAACLSLCCPDKQAYVGVDLFGNNTAKGAVDIFANAETETKKLVAE
jgi:hypothetical protein